MLGVILGCANALSGGDQPPHVHQSTSNVALNSSRKSRGSLSFEKLARKKHFGEPVDGEVVEEATVESILSTFYLSNGTLRRMMTQMSKDMERGLIGGLRSSTVAMLPSFVPRVPDGHEVGRYLAMDLGGTNLRVMLMELRKGQQMKTSQHNFRIPNYAMHGTGAQLFDFIVECLAGFLDEKDLLEANLPLGFTFSYPCDQTSLCSAKLLRWTKGFNSSGVEGRDVVQILEQAIQRNGRLKVRVVALVNDTVGTQVATAYEYGACELGVIIATGTNASYMESVSRIPKLDEPHMAPYHYDQMIIDTEWGGFGDRGEAEYIMTKYDKMIDAASVHPGVQIFDKLVAGMYMGEYARLVCLDLIDKKLLFNGEASDPMLTAGSFPTKYISEILGDEGGTYIQTRQIFDELGIDDYQFPDILILREVCMIVSRRSANLAAAAIACCIRRIGKDSITVGIDGSTYKYHPFYHTWVRDKVNELLEGSVKFTIVQASDGSGKGAALIAAIADQLEQEKPKSPTKRSSPLKQQSRIIENGQPN